MKRLNKTESANFVSMMCSLLPEDLHSEFILISLFYFILICFLFILFYFCFICPFGKFERIYKGNVLGMFS